MWLLNLAEKLLDKDTALRKWQDELGLVGKMLTRDERNFHGWDYRRHVVARLESLRSPEQASMVEPEFEYTTKMIRKALQNFSALHYRSKLMPRLLNEREADPAQRRKMLEQELNLMEDALIDPYNQSAWFYHQFLMSTLQSHAAEQIVKDLSDDDRIHYYEQEIDRIKEMLEDFDDCKWIYLALVQYVMQLESIRPGSLSPPEVSEWLAELRRLDPARMGRWNHLEKALNG
jgi:geranylgeranyl transferase type-2 subunit alpha